MEKALQFLIKWPTRSRPKQFMRCLTAWLGALSWTQRVHFLVNQDVDDPTRVEVYARSLDLRGPGLEVFLPGTPGACAAPARVVIEFIEGEPKTKIEAVNFGMDAAPVFDVLVNGSDDMWPEVPAVDLVITQEMLRYWPNLDGALNFWDGSPGQKDLCTLSIMGFGLFRRFGYIYHPAYVSLYADDEYTLACRLLGRMADPEGWRRGERVLVRHKHPCMNGGHAVYDALMKRNESFYQTDVVTFEKRKAQNFDYRPEADQAGAAANEGRGASHGRIDRSVYPVRAGGGGGVCLAPPAELERSPFAGTARKARAEVGGPAAWRPSLSILICGLECRRQVAARLLRSLEAQRQALEFPDDVEILYLVDAGQRTVGAKRNELLAAAGKEWVCFFDDDDRAMGDYLEIILDALATRPDVVGVSGICAMNAHRGWTSQTSVHLFRHGLEFGPRQQTPYTVTHRPFPISVFRAELARQAVFPDKSLQEDDVWATAIRPLLKTSATIYDPIYFYDWRADRTATQTRPEIALARASGTDRAWQSPPAAVRTPRPPARVPVAPRPPAPHVAPATQARWGVQRPMPRPAPRPNRPAGPPAGAPSGEVDAPTPAPVRTPEA